MRFIQALVGLVLTGLVVDTSAASSQKHIKRRPPFSRQPRAPAGYTPPEHLHNHAKRQFPPPVNGTTNATSPNGYSITYKETTSSGICENTPGVRSFSGYINTGDNRHTFFWFFEARNNKSTAGLTAWINGGPGSSSMIGLFQENGPCRLTPNLTVLRNDYSWNEYSHMLYIDQPVGTGFSYQSAQPGVLDEVTGVFVPTNTSSADGIYPAINATALDDTDLAAVVFWEVVQTFISVLPSIDSNVTTKTFNLATESYGGHYGPAFFNYSQVMNNAISSGSMNATKLTMGSLLIINGILDEAVQAPFFPIMASQNTYGIKAVNDTVYNYMVFANSMLNGCQDQVAQCREVDISTAAGQAICSEATSMCRDNVEGPYYAYSGRGVYDIREPYGNPELVDSFIPYLNLPRVQAALGVPVNYSESNADIYYAFQQTGDFVYSTFLPDLARIVNSGVRVSLMYGDADYICNWFGGQAVSLAVNYTNAAQFKAAGYAPMVVNGTQYGETRQYGNFSFTRVYNAGHEIPFYQPIAALAGFRRTIQGLSMIDGGVLNATSASSGPSTATHTASSVFFGTSTSSVASMSSSSASVAPTGTTIPRRRLAGMW